MNPSYRTPISYSTEFRLDINLNNLEVGKWEGRGGGVKYLIIPKVLHTYIQTSRPSDKAVCRAFAHNKQLFANPVIKICF